MANFIAFGVFLGVAVFVGMVWGYQRLSPVRDWLRADRAPDEDEQRLTLRAPRRILLVNSVPVGAGRGGVHRGELRCSRLSLAVVVAHRRRRWAA